MSTKHYSSGAAAGDTDWVIGARITITLTGAESDGRYLIEVIVSEPGGGPSFLHSHSPMETFHILEGQFEIYYQDEAGTNQTITANVGDLVHVPGGVPHGFKNSSDDLARVLVTYHPADMMEAFFRDIGIKMVDRYTPPVLDGPPDVDQAVATFLKHGMTLIENPAES
jgi:quercetin dioxygenase-like cupin family protein